MPQEGEIAANLLLLYLFLCVCIAEKLLQPVTPRGRPSPECLETSSRGSLAPPLSGKTRDVGTQTEAAFPWTTHEALYLLLAQH